MISLSSAFPCEYPLILTSPRRNGFRFQGSPPFHAMAYCWPSSPPLGAHGFRFSHLPPTPFPVALASLSCLPLPFILRQKGMPSPPSHTIPIYLSTSVPHHSYLPLSPYCPRRLSTPGFGREMWTSCYRMVPSTPLPHTILTLKIVCRAGRNLCACCASLPYARLNPLNHGTSSRLHLTLCPTVSPRGISQW